MEGIFYIILGLTIAGSVVAVPVLFIRKGMEKWIHKTWFVVLWAIVFLRLCIPFSLSSPVSALNVIPLWAEGSGSEYITMVSSYAEGTVMQAFQAGENTGAGIQGNEDSNEGNHGEQTPEGLGVQVEADEASGSVADEGAFVSLIRNWAIKLGWIWLGGACCCFAFLALVYIWSIKKLKESLLTAEEHKCVLTGFKQIQDIVSHGGAVLKMGDRRTKHQVKGIVLSDQYGPCTAGVMRQRIILPLHILDHFPRPDHSVKGDLPDGGKLTEREIRHVLMHEMIHIKRRDNLKRILSLLVVCLHWFNPLVWICCRCFLKDMEASCDEKVIELLGEQEKRPYALSLFRFAGEKGEKRKTAGAGVLVSFGESDAGRRVKNVLEYEKMGKKKIIVTAVLTCCLLLGFMTNPQGIRADAESFLLPGHESQSLVYAGNDGLYYVDIRDLKNREFWNEGFDDDGNFEGTTPVKIVSGEGISNPVFSADGSVVTFLQNGSLYGYRFTDGMLKTLAEEFISYCAGRENTFYVSTREGIIQVGMDVEDQQVLTGAKGSEEWEQYEHLSLSPDGLKLAFSKSAYRVNDNEGYSDFQQSLGVFVLDLSGLENLGESTGMSEEVAGKRLQQVQGASETVAEYLSGEDSGLYAISYPGKWSPDSGRLFIWQDIMSGSIHADGIGGAVYDFDKGQLIMLEEEQDGFTVLGYEENVQFDNNGRLLVLEGSGRDMAYGKSLAIVGSAVQGKQKSRLAYETLEILGLVPAMPVVNREGSVLYFAGAEDKSDLMGQAPVDWEQVYSELYPIKRQIYVLENNNIRKLTDDPAYTCESPVLTDDESHLIFGRIKEDGAMSIWSMSLDDGSLKQLVQMEENAVIPSFSLTVSQLPAEQGEPAQPDYSRYPANYDDYYGRGSWHSIFAVY